MEQIVALVSKQGRLACLRLGFSREDLLPISQMPVGSIPLKFRQFSEQFLVARRQYLQEQRLLRINQFNSQLLKIQCQPDNKVSQSTQQTHSSLPAAAPNLYPLRCQREFLEKVQKQKEFACKEELIGRRLQQVFETKKNMLMEKARTLEERRLHHQIIADNINRDYLSKAEEKVYRTVKKQEAAVLSKQYASSEQQAKFKEQAGLRREQQDKIKIKNMRAEQDRRKELEKILAEKQAACEGQLKKNQVQKMGKIEERSRREFEKQILAERNRNLLQRDKAGTIHEANQRYLHIDFKRLKKSEQKQRLHQTFVEKNQNKFRKIQMRIAKQEQQRQVKQYELYKHLHQSMDKASAIRQDSVNQKIKAKIWEYLHQQQIKRRHCILNRQIQFQRKQKMALKQRSQQLPRQIMYRIYSRRSKKTFKKHRKSTNQAQQSQLITPDIKTEVQSQPQKPEKFQSKVTQQQSNESFGDLIQMTNNLHEPTIRFMQQLRLSIVPFLHGKQCKDITDEDVTRVQLLARQINLKLEEMYKDVRHKI